MTFQASVVIVVTWDRVQQYFPSVDYKPTNMGDATFQVALVTDWSESYALVQYRVGHMTWRYPGRWYSIQMGVAKGEITTFQPNVYSGTELAYEIDSFYGNSGYKGYWVYQLGKIPASYTKTCQAWLRRNKNLKKQREAGFAALPKCPCSRRGIFRAVVRQWRFHRRDERNQFECVILNVARTGQFAPFGKECCYSTNPLKPDTLDMLITSPPFAGAALAFNPLVFAQEKLYDAEDRIPHVACCEHGTNKQCRRYYNLRPIGKCDPNPAMQWTPLYGDPQITTMDGRRYLYNGLAEITLVKINTSNVSFTLQARTQRAELRLGTPTNGTVFTAVGAEENGVRVFLQIDPNTNTTLIVYAGGRDYTTRFNKEGDDFIVDDGSVLLTRDNDTCVVSFPSGISLQIYIRMKALVIGIAMPHNFQTLTKGMLGNFNGDETDDFILPSGERLNNSLSERQIFNLFANKWLVNANNSVMRYEARMGPADFYRQDFQPVFLDEVDPSRLTQAKNLCGDTNMPCIYDFLATGDESFAFQTSDLRNLSDILIQQSKNTAPVLQVPEAVYVTIHVVAAFVVTGVDPDVSDSLTYRLLDDANGILRIDQSTGEVSVNMTSLTPFKIEIYAVDSVGTQSPVESIPIVACSGCSGHGTCNMSDTRDVLGDHDFQFAVCRCGPAWAGDNCELDKDGCSDSPCHPLRTCTDIPASRQGDSDIGYTCSACPQGFFMKNDSKDCFDVDECLISTLHGCDMICTNTYGSYECSCQEGYRLSTNGHSCTDVNECIERTHDCQQICTNTAGGFQCECEAGYTYDSTSKSCTVNADFPQVCRTSTCSQGCRVITDAAKISRPQCFCYLGYDLDVRDNATCVDRDECRDKVCDQVCNNTAGGFSCSCYDGFALNKDERTCSACPYLKYGPECRQTCTCSGRSVACHPVRGCVCQDGWTGTTCADDVDECVENPDVCGSDQTCVNNKGSYSCVCRSGYASDDSGVCRDIDECTTDIPCKENQQCNNIPGGYYCSCNPGYTKSNTGNCTDVNECAANRGDCQHDCVNVLGSFNCECKYGYRLNADRKTCTEVREVCVIPTTCSKADGCTLDDNNNDLCFCNSGYTINQNTQTCQDIDECTTGLANCSHNCTNTPDSFTCSCPVGKKLDNDGLTCSTCLPGTFGPNCTQVCACAAGAERCDAVSGCVCRQGWEGEKCDKDVDECQQRTLPANCTGANVECVNTNGGYTCRCRQGYAADNNGVCQDINECSEPVCDQNCNNTIGSYVCTCDNGFYWNTTTLTCKDVDECATLETNVCTQRCENTAGSFRCSCNVTGYILNNDGFTCRLPAMNSEATQTPWTEVTSLSTDLTKVTSLSTDLTKVTSLSTDLTKVTSLSTDLTKVTSLSTDDLTDVTSLSTDNLTDVTSLNTDNLTDVTSLSTDNLTDVTSLNTDNSTEESATPFASVTSKANDTDLSTDVSNTTATAELTTGQIAGIVVGSVGGVAVVATAVGFVVLKVKAHMMIGVQPLG
ncbi:mucin-like protein isoform X1 [Pomacea canaliculata]|uniref:mucin-like protein isoform X1 n=1 Tax=Pomacea canaliculata TaxID=400727 RepID=UPI000D72C3B1|nr:mucin-like protein isoform X1 [Pomacea canaliculata]